MSPTLFALLFLLLSVLCDRQNRQMDPLVIHPLVAERLAEHFDTAASVSAIAAFVPAVWLLLRGRDGPDSIARVIAALTAIFGLSRLIIVH